MSDVLLAVEIASPGTPRYDYQTKRTLYRHDGVPEHWIVNPEARNISRLTGGNDTGEVLSRTIAWHPPAMAGPVVIDIVTMFEHALS